MNDLSKFYHYHRAISPIPLQKPHDIDDLARELFEVMEKVVRSRIDKHKFRKTYLNLLYTKHQELNGKYRL